MTRALANQRSGVIGGAAPKAVTPARGSEKAAPPLATQAAPDEDFADTTPAAYPVWPVLFVTTMCLPFIFWFGTFRMSPYRVILLIAFIPAIITWLSGRVGKPTMVDLCFLAASIWATTALFINGNFSEVYQTSGILLIETFGSYLLGRVYVTNYEQFLRFTKYLWGVLLVLLPFAMYETLAHQNLILSNLKYIGNTFPPIDIGARMGLYRAHVIFEHPILWGVFASSLFGVLTYTLGKSVLSRSVTGLMATAATISSVSSGALVSLAVQMIIMAWDKFTIRIKRRWRLLGGIAIGLYVLVDMISTRTPFQVFITYLTFSSQSSYNRVNIWTFGTAEVWRHPIFGIGLGDWERPSYMSASMDNFWLATAVRYGLPTLIMFSYGIIRLMYLMGRSNLTDPGVIRARTGLMATYIGIIFSGCTVHYWNSMYCWVLFLFGIGHWMIKPPAHAVAKQEEPAVPEKSAQSVRQVIVTPRPRPVTAQPPKAPASTPNATPEKRWLK